MIVDAQTRPSIIDLLKMNIVKKKCQELEHTTEYFDAVDSYGPEARSGDISDDPLLKTIRVPNNLVNLTDRLPRSNYSKLRDKKNPKQKKRIQTDTEELEHTVQTLGSGTAKNIQSKTNLYQNLPQI